MATHSDSLFLEITGQIKNRFYMGTSGKIGIDGLREGDSL